MPLALYGGNLPKIQEIVKNWPTYFHGHKKCPPIFILLHTELNVERLFGGIVPADVHHIYKNNLFSQFDNVRLRDS